MIRILVEKWNRLFKAKYCVITFENGTAEVWISKRWIPYWIYADIKIFGSVEQASKFILEDVRSNIFGKQPRVHYKFYDQDGCLL